MGDGGDDKLVLEGMQFFAHHGDVEAERALGTHFFVDVEIDADLSAAGRSDSLDDTLDYVRCYALIREVVEGQQFRLLEAVAEAIAQALLHEPRATRVRVRVAKQPPIDGTIERCAVVLQRGVAS